MWPTICTLPKKFECCGFIWTKEKNEANLHHVKRNTIFVVDSGQKHRILFSFILSYVFCDWNVNCFYLAFVPLMMVLCMRLTARYWNVNEIRAKSQNGHVLNKAKKKVEKRKKTQTNKKATTLLKYECCSENDMG